MSMLLTSYKLEKSRETSNLFESDIKELQVLLNRIQKLYLHMTEKGEIAYEERLKHVESVINEKEAFEKELNEQITSLKQQLEDSQKAYKEESQKVKQAQEVYKQIEIELKEQKVQLKNNLLLHEKYDAEITGLKDQLAGYERLEVEISERNDENSKLKNRNDELASEVWFLQREIEKLNEEKNQLLIKSEADKVQLETTHQLALKNKLLEQKLQLTEEINHLREENHKLERYYNQKLQELYNKLPNNVEKTN